MTYSNPLAKYIVQQPIPLGEHLHLSSFYTSWNGDISFATILDDSSYNPSSYVISYNVSIGSWSNKTTPVTGSNASVLHLIDPLNIPTTFGDNAVIYSYDYLSFSQTVYLAESVSLPSSLCEIFPLFQVNLDDSAEIVSLSSFKDDGQFGVFTGFRLIISNLYQSTYFLASLTFPFYFRDNS
jgi:hypothetical protein